MKGEVVKVKVCEDLVYLGFDVFNNNLKKELIVSILIK